MVIDKKVYIGIDTAYQHGMVVLFSDAEVLFSISLPDKMGHAKALCPALAQVVDYAKAHGFSLAAVFCGLGPGSFVGVRIALATALGFSFAKALPLMGFCSHEALAKSLVQGDFSLFMKASGDLGYFTPFAMNTAEAKTQVLSLSDFLAAPHELIFSDMHDKIAQAGVMSHELLGPSAGGVMQAALSQLSEKGLQDQSDSIAPNYVKPPNVSIPKQAFTFLAG